MSLAAGAAAGFAHGQVRSYALAIDNLAIAVWAYLEITDGVNWFRRLLGSAVLVLTVIGVARALRP